MTDYKKSTLTGISYSVNTPDDVVAVLDRYYHADRRLRVFYGDKVTGKCWGDEYNTIGAIGRSTGKYQIPLMIANSRSLGGGAVLDDCIVKIMDVQTKRVLYQHPTFNQPAYTIAPPPEKIGNADMAADGYTHGVYADGENIANFKSIVQAARWVKFMIGERMAK